MPELPTPGVRSLVRVVWIGIAIFGLVVGRHDVALWSMVFYMLTVEDKFNEGD